MVRHNNQLPYNLPQLQNLIKRDAESYKEEFQQQYQHFLSVLDIFRCAPGESNKTLEDLCMFLAQVAPCYPAELKTFPQTLMDVLRAYCTVLDASVRAAFCRALILLRNRNMLAPTDLLALFFELLRCHDKELRKFLQTHIVNDVRNVNAKSRNQKLNTTLQNFMYAMMNDSNSRAAKMSVDIMVDLYKKNVWNDAKTVNVLATGCFSKIFKVMATCLKFFLGSDPDEKDSDDSDSDEEVTAKEVMQANKYNKKSRKREKLLTKAKKLVVKAKKKKNKAPAYNFSALHLIHDPQGFAEKLMRQLETTNDKFDIKLVTLDVISRLIGLHSLFLLNYYPYIQRYLQPHQREVTRLLQFAAQACHDLVPPESIEPVIRAIVNNFVSERNSSDVMAIGLNAIREICARCPLAMTEDLLWDLTMYKTYRDKAVMMAAKSLVTLYRHAAPELLRRKDRGRPTEAAFEMQVKPYGHVDAKEYIPGAEVLLKAAKKDDIEISDDSDDDDDDDDDDGDSDDEQWVDVSGSDEWETDEDAEQDEMKGDSKEGVITEAKTDAENDHAKTDAEIDSKTDPIASRTPSKVNKKERRKILKAKRLLGATQTKSPRLPAEKIAEIKNHLTERILTNEDFRQIEIANLRKHGQTVKKGEKRTHAASERTELVKLSDIEMIHKKRKHDKLARMASVRDGQTDRERFGYKDGRVNEHCSRTNREKRKNKNFMMMKHKVRGKVKRSFKDKQIALRNHLVKQKKMK